MTTNSAHSHAIEPNLLGQGFFSRRVIGWNLDTRMTANLAVTALQRAIALCQPLRSTRQDVEQAITRYINDFYNPQRLHSALQRKSSLDHERNAA
ncbi:hypothetical protein [Kozakia baliensis]|uniref:hypothetical protein n=1 Tax=Kozakia baliensis TaxID=153496 RepID=UPI0012696F51|nr:hypothetical protein [Kozakia baliensis]